MKKLEQIESNDSHNLKIIEGLFNFSEAIIERFDRDDALFTMRLARQSLHLAFDKEFEIPTKKRIYESVD